MLRVETWNEDALWISLFQQIAAKILTLCGENVDKRTKLCNLQNNEVSPPPFQSTQLQSADAIWQGNTPLHVAFALGDMEMATFLLTHGGKGDRKWKRRKREWDFFIIFW